QRAANGDVVFVDEMLGVEVGQREFRVNVAEMLDVCVGKADLGLPIENGFQFLEHRRLDAIVGIKRQNVFALGGGESRVARAGQAAVGFFDQSDPFAGEFRNQPAGHVARVVG